MPGSITSTRKLESWKEIASYIGKTERTAKRWEHDRGLPVHRVPGGGRQVVFAYTHEVDAWLLGDGVADTSSNDSPLETAAIAISDPASAPEEQLTAPGRTVRKILWWLVGAGSAGALFAAVIAVAMLHQGNLAVTNPTRITQSPSRVLSPLLSDGARIYYPEFQDDRFSVAETPTSGGASTNVATSISNPEICDLSKDGSAMLLRSLGSSRDEQAPVYIQPRAGSPQRAGDIIAYDAAWYPDGNTILYSTDGEVYSTDAQGHTRERLFTVPGNAFWFRWSPDTRKLRFTVIDKKNEETSIWEFSEGARDAHRVFGELPFQLCCGSWTPDGKQFLFQVRNGNSFEIWASQEERGFLSPSRNKTFPLVVGATSYRGPLPSKDGKRLFVRAEVPKDEIVRYDPKAKEFIPLLPISARTLAFSADGVWVAYTSLTDNSLWRCRADGTNCLRLTQEFKDTVMPRWSPDGRTIAFMGLSFKGPWGIYAIAPDGADMHLLSHSDYAQGFPDWSPDGRRLAFGEVPPLSLPRGIHTLDLATNNTQTLSGSADYFFPRWSPDGRYIAALHVGDQSLSLFDVSSHKRRPLVSFSTEYPSWSRDGSHIYLVSIISGKRMILRVRIADGAIETIANLTSVERTPFFMGDWVGLGNDDAPLAVRNLTTEDIYAWDLVSR